MPLFCSKKGPSARPEAGFTLLGLLLSFAMCGLFALLCLPVYMKARDTATLRSTMADMHMWAEAIQDYTSDFGTPPSNPNGRLHFKKQILRDLLPYLRQVRIIDWWCNSYWIWIGPGIHEYGIATTGTDDFIIASFGERGVRENWTFDPLRPEDGLFRIRNLEDFERDIVLWNGKFLRGPAGS